MLNITGVIKGVKTEQINGPNGVFEKHFVGFEMPAPNGFEGETTVEKVQVSRQQFEKGLFSTYEKLKGKRVTADVFINTFRTREGAGYQLFLSGEGKPYEPGQSAQ